MVFKAAGEPPVVAQNLMPPISRKDDGRGLQQKLHLGRIVSGPLRFLRPLIDPSLTSRVPVTHAFLWRLRSTKATAELFHDWHNRFEGQRRFSQQP